MAPPPLTRHLHWCRRLHLLRLTARLQEGHEHSEMRKHRLPRERDLCHRAVQHQQECSRIPRVMGRRKDLELELKHTDNFPEYRDVIFTTRDQRPTDLWGREPSSFGRGVELFEGTDESGEVGACGV